MAWRPGSDDGVNVPRESPIKFGRDRTNLIYSYGKVMPKDYDIPDYSMNEDFIPEAKSTEDEILSQMTRLAYGTPESHEFSDNDDESLDNSVESNFCEPSVEVSPGSDSPPSLSSLRPDYCFNSDHNNSDSEDSFDSSPEELEQKLTECLPAFTPHNPVIMSQPEDIENESDSDNFFTIDELLSKILCPFVPPSTDHQSIAKRKSLELPEIYKASRSAYSCALKLYPKKDNETPEERENRLQKVREHAESIKLNPDVIASKTSPLDSMDPSIKTEILQVRKVRRSVYNRACNLYPKKDNETPVERKERLRKICEHAESIRASEYPETITGLMKMPRMRLAESMDPETKATILQARRERKAAYNRQRKANETLEQKKTRLEKMRESYRAKHPQKMKKTTRVRKIPLPPEVNRANLAYLKAYRKYPKKDAETPEERQDRLGKIQEHQESIIANMDPEMALKLLRMRSKVPMDHTTKAAILKARRERKAAYNRQRKANETPEQREVHLQKLKGYYKQKLANETSGQQEDRIAKKREQFPDVRKTDKIIEMDEVVDDDQQYEKNYQELISSMTAEQVADVEKTFHEFYETVALKKEQFYQKHLDYMREKYASMTEEPKRRHIEGKKARPDDLKNLETDDQRCDRSEKEYQRIIALMTTEQVADVERTYLQFYGTVALKRKEQNCQKHLDHMRAKYASMNEQQRQIHRQYHREHMRMHKANIIKDERKTAREEQKRRYEWKKPIADDIKDLETNDQRCDRHKEKYQMMIGSMSPEENDDIERMCHEARPKVQHRKNTGQELRKAKLGPSKSVKSSHGGWQVTRF